MQTWRILPLCSWREGIKGIFVKFEFSFYYEMLTKQLPMTISATKIISEFFSIHLVKFLNKQKLHDKRKATHVYKAVVILILAALGCTAYK